MGIRFVRSLEDLFEKCIEGFLNKKIAGELQPVEIAKQLFRAMEDARSISVDHIYVPNGYVVYVSKQDYDRMLPYQETICTELANYLNEQASRRGFTLVGNPLISLEPDESLLQGNVRINAEYTEPSMEMPSGGSAESELSDTRVFTKLSPAAGQQEGRMAVLQVVEGVDEGKSLEIGKRRINLGRREGNELTLTDMNTSRLHSYIIYEDNSHILHDANSLNGLYVNGQRVSRKVLRSGDEIKLGNTVIVYEVK